MQELNTSAHSYDYDPFIQHNAVCCLLQSCDDLFHQKNENGKVAEEDTVLKDFLQTDVNTGTLCQRVMDYASLCIYAQAFILTRKQMQARARTCASRTYTHKQTHTQTHTSTHTYTHTHIHAHTRTQTHTHTRSHTYTHTHIDTHAHPHAHTRTQTHTYAHART